MKDLCVLKSIKGKKMQFNIRTTRACDRFPEKVFYMPLVYKDNQAMGYEILSRSRGVKIERYVKYFRHNYALECTHSNISSC